MSDQKDKKEKRAASALVRRDFLKIFWREVEVLETLKTHRKTLRN